MTRVITIAGTAITSTSDLDSIVVGGQAKQGDSALSEIILYDDSNALFGASEAFIRKQWSVTEDASGTAVYLARGRIDAFETHRGEEDSVQGVKVQYSFVLEDQNLELRGHDVDDWERPEETGYARVTALGTAYLNGSPRTSTNLDTTTYVPNSNTVTMPAKTYVNADAIAVITECAAAEDKKFFVTVDHELFYDLESSTAYATTLEISDGVGAAADPDGTNYFAPIWDMGSALSWEGQNYASGVRLAYNQDSSVIVTDSTSESAHDSWVAHVADTETTDAAMATAFATAELSYRKSGERTYALALKIPAAQAYKIKVGQVIWIQAQAAVDTTARAQRRIAELMWEPDGPYWYIARLNLDRPVRRRVRGSVSGATLIGPHPAPECLPDTPGVSLITWDFEQGTSFDTTATYDSDLNYSASGPGSLNGSAYGYTDASSRTTDSFAVTASSDYTLSLEYKFKFDSMTAYVKVHWQNSGGSHIDEDLILTQTGHATGTTYETTKNVTAPVGAAFAYIDFSGRSAMSVDNVIWGDAGIATVNDPYCLTDPGDSPYFAKSDDPRFDQIGAGSTTADGAAAYVLTEAPAGGFETAQNECAVSHGGYTYFGYIEGDGGAYVAAIEEATRTVETPQLLRALVADIHNQPVLLVRDSDHKLVVIYTEHATTGVYRRISTNSLDTDPTLSGGFAAEGNLHASLGGTDYTYPSLFERADGGVYLIIRRYKGGANHADQTWGWSKSTDGGDTWAALTTFYTEPGKGGYVVPRLTDGEIVDLLVLEDAWEGTPPISVYHGYFDLSAETFHKSDGTSAGTLPFEVSDLTLVYDATGTNANCRHGSVARRGDLVYMVFTEVISTSDVRTRWATYDGSWTSLEVAADNQMAANVTGNVGHSTLDPLDPRIVWASVQVDDFLEMRRFAVDEAGNVLALGGTSGLAVDRFWPLVPRNRSSQVPMLCMSGTFTDTLTWTADIITIVGLAIDDFDAAVGASALDDLSDVTITAAATGDKLRYDGTGWVNANLHDEPMVLYDGTVMLNGNGDPMMHEVAW